MSCPAHTLVILTALCTCQPTPTLTTRPQATLTVTTKATNKPQPTPTLPKEQVTVTREATITPPVPPTPILNTWKSFKEESAQCAGKVPILYASTMVRKGRAQTYLDLEHASGLAEKVPLTSRGFFIAQRNSEMGKGICV
jgi:hypothetical protein